MRGDGGAGYRAHAHLHCRRSRGCSFDLLVRDVRWLCNVAFQFRCQLFSSPFGRISFFGVAAYFEADKNAVKQVWGRDVSWRNVSEVLSFFGFDSGIAILFGSIDLWWSCESFSLHAGWSVWGRNGFPSEGHFFSYLEVAGRESLVNCTRGTRSWKRKFFTRYVWRSPLHSFFFSPYYCLIVSLQGMDFFIHNRPMIILSNIVLYGTYAEAFVLV